MVNTVKYTIGKTKYILHFRPKYNNKDEPIEVYLKKFSNTAGYYRNFVISQGKTKQIALERAKKFLKNEGDGK